MGGVPPIGYEVHDHSSLSPTARRTGAVHFRGYAARGWCGSSGKSSMPQASGASGSGQATKASLNHPSSEMNRQLLTVAATAIFWAHVAVIAFNVFGLIAIPLGARRAWRFVRIFWWRALHLGALALVALQAVLEQRFGKAIFSRAGESGSNEPMIQKWISRIIFWPFPLWVFAVLYVGVCIYTLLLWRLVPPQLPWARNPRTPEAKRSGRA